MCPERQGSANAEMFGNPDVYRSWLSPPPSPHTSFDLGRRLSFMWLNRGENISPSHSLSTTLPIQSSMLGPVGNILGTNAGYTTKSVDYKMTEHFLTTTLQKIILTTTLLKKTKFWLLHYRIFVEYIMKNMLTITFQKICPLCYEKFVDYFTEDSGLHKET